MLTFSETVIYPPRDVHPQRRRAPPLGGEWRHGRAGADATSRWMRASLPSNTVR